MKKSGLNGYVYFSVDYNTFNVGDILNIHKYLMKNKIQNNSWIN